MAGGSVSVPRPEFGRHNLWPLILVVLILGFALFGERGILHMLKLSSQKASLVEEITRHEVQNEALRREIDALKNDRGYIERVARTELGMVRDDELVFQFSDPK